MKRFLANKANYRQSAFTSPPPMSQSLSPECTPLKKEYDSCFNSWFEGYLEPAVFASSSSTARAAYSKRKAEEFQQRCGKIWEQYKSCVQVRLSQIFTSIYRI